MRCFDQVFLAIRVGNRKMQPGTEVRRVRDDLGALDVARNAFLRVKDDSG